MKRSHEMIESAAMGRRVHVWFYGHWGAPLVVFPSAAGFAHEWERQGMLEVLAPLIYGGKIKVYCPESNVSEAWTDKEADPRWRIQRHLAYERFVLDDLVPAVRADCQQEDIRIATSGVSFGAFYAANFALKFPDIFHYALCMSGRYDATNFTGGYSDMDIYFNNPIAYASNLEGEELDRVKDKTHLTLVCGQGKWEEGCIEETHQLGDILAAKGVSCHKDIWGQDVSHDWIWWQRQALFHFNKTFG